MPTTSRPGEPINRATIHIARPARITVTPRRVITSGAPVTGTATSR